ncbi:MAG TPA: aminoglycoside phosphotransferase family protein [Solirubrobacterales bacterium]|nr:aminoglycoside phosphotransferase family protein [Solirubrobacterales bacterium]
MAASRQPSVNGVAGPLAEVLAAADPGARPVAEERLSGRVRRVTLSGGRRSSLVVKRVDRAAARKTELLSSRWLPTVGLQDRGPPLLASAPGRQGSVWQAFEDLGECALSPDRPQPGDLEAATGLVAQLHVAFAGHDLLPRWIEELGGLDERFYADWVRRAAGAVESIRTAGLSTDRLAVRDRLSRRIEALLEQEPGRTRRLREAGWPVTLLHGDLWPQNVLLPAPRGDRRRARLIDWDQASVGPVVYDLSTFIFRLSSPVRLPALRLYGRAVRAAGWRLPRLADLNDAFETAECARLASCLVSPAEAAGEGAAWAFEDLRAIEGWFAAMRPVLTVSPR